MSNDAVEASYAALAEYYDAEHANLTEDLPAYDLLADRFAGRILDIGCGTGRVALPLVQAGHAVVGIDISEEMLDIARSRSTDIEWVHADVRTWHTGQRFMLAIFSYNGFSHMLTQSAQLSALRAIRKLLLPGGGLVIDMANPLLLVQQDEDERLERTFQHAGQQVVQHSHIMVDAVAQILSVRWAYRQYGAETQTEIPMQMRYVFAPEMQLLLQMTGYGRIEQYGDYDFEPYKAEAPRLFTVAFVD